ncbi:NAD(P)/FAD-dependent oxidoreductase [Sinomonas atrocyanea]
MNELTEREAPAVVIVGSGHAGVAVAAGLRTRGWEGRVVLVESDGHVPYERPPLSKELLAPGAPTEATPLRKAAWFEGKGIERVRGTAAAIDRPRHELALEDGRVLPYTKLVLATGSTPRRLPVPGADLGGVLALKTLDDARQLARELAPRAGRGRRAVIVGAGYIGLEVAAAAAKLGCDVTVLEFQDRVMSRVTSEPVSRFFEDLHARAGVRFVFGAAVSGFEGQGGRVARVLTADGGRFPADVVVAGIGVLPGQRLAEAAGLDVGDGILVDANGQTSDPDVYAAGDATRSADAYDGASLRLECIQNARAQAEAVAAHVAGAAAPPAEVPWFWTVQHGVRLQTAGVRRPDDEVILRGSPADGKFSVVYLRDSRVAAIDTVGSLADFTAGKKLVSRRAPLDAHLAADPSVPLEQAVAPLEAAAR